MKKNVSIICFISLVLSFQLNAQNKWFDRLCSNNQVVVNQLMVAEGGMLGRIIEKSDAFYGVHLIRTVAIKSDKKSKMIIEKLSKNLQKRGFQSNRLEDNQVNIWFLKKEEGQISEIWMIASYLNSFVILNMNGKIDMEQLSQISYHPQIPVLGYLGKIYKKS